MREWLAQWKRRTRVVQFLGLVWRRDDYLLQGGRHSIAGAWFIAGVVADTCRSIQREKPEAA
jgi:hypothetical protein